MKKKVGFLAIVLLIALSAACLLFVSCNKDEEEDIDPSLDSDGDKIKDIVEVSDLGESLGLNRYRKDIVVEVDYLVRTVPDAYGRTSYRFENNAVNLVTQMFNNAPVNNPKGDQGISIHIIVDDAIPNDNPYTGWTDAQGYYDWTEFQVFRDTFFTSEYKPFAHYCLFIKDIGFLDENGNIRGISGISRNGADFFTGAQDFIVALGSWPSAEGGTYVYDKYQAGTFAHELGHNLGLGHGGQDHINYKPNYLSIMNYSFQTLGLIKTGQGYYSTYDYSRLMLPDLNEVTPNQTCSNLSGWAPYLNEPAGLTGAAGGYGTIYYYYNNFWRTIVVQDASANIDWNRNNQIDGSLVWANINQDLLYCGQNVYHNLTRLAAATDWDKLSYSAGGYFGGSSSGQSAKPDTLEKTPWTDELTYEMHRKMMDTREE